MLVFALASVAYAQEQVEDTVSVPFIFDDKLCGISIIGTFICEWNPFASTEETDDIETTVTVPEVEVIEEPLVEEEESETVTYRDPTPDKKTPYEAARDRFEKSPPKSLADQEYFELVKQLALCKQGLRESAGVQDVREFEVSVAKTASLKALDYTGSYRVLVTAMEECRVQHTILEPITLGAQYLNRSGFVGYVEVPHGERMLVRMLGTFPAVNLTERDYIKALEKAQDEGMCRNNLFSEVTKAMYGCSQPEYDTVPGDIEYTSPAWHKYQLYKNQEQFVNVSVRDLNTVDGTIGSFIAQHGGYDRAIDAIKWKQHFDATSLEDMAKEWNE